MDRRDFLKTGATVGVTSALGGEVLAKTPAPGGGFRLTGDYTPHHLPALHQIGLYAAKHRRFHHLPGMTLALVGPNGLDARITLGEADLETKKPVHPEQLFQIGSISKSFTAALIHQLASEGRLGLNDPVSQHLAGLPLPEGVDITINHLLAHSSGLPEEAPAFPRTPDGKLWVGFKPGSAWSYSNIGFALLGNIVEAKDGRKLADSLKRRIFDKLGMQATKGSLQPADRPLYATGYAQTDPDADYEPGVALFPAPFDVMTDGAGCIGSNSPDMTKWLRWLIGAGAGQGGAVMSDAAAKAFAQPQIEAPGWAFKGASYGSGLAYVPLEGRMVMQHTGGMTAFHSSMHVDPKAAVGVFVSVNSGAGDYRPRDVSAYACALLRAAVAPEPGLHPKPAPLEWKKPAAAKLDTEGAKAENAALAGRYGGHFLSYGTVQLIAVKEGLALPDGTQLEKVEAGYWRVKGAPDIERFWFFDLLNGRPQTLSVSGLPFERLEP